MATIRRRGDTWQINYVENGRRIRKSLGKIDRASAERIRRRVDADTAYGATLLSAPGSPTLDAFAVDYMMWYEGEYPASAFRVESALKWHLCPEFGSTPISDIEPAVVERWKSARRAHAKAATVSKELRILKAMLNRAVDWNLIDRNPIAKVKEPRNIDSKPPQWYTADELTSIYNACVEAWHRSTWRLAANTGLRRAELLHLRRRDIREDRLHVLSRESERTKSGKWREVPLNEPARAAIEELPGSDYLLPTMNPRSLTRAFDHCAGRATVGGSLHCLRHTYGAHMVMAGVGLRTLQKLMGHAHFSTTEKYAHLAPDHLAGTANKIAL